MVTQTVSEVLKHYSFFRGLDDEELEQVSDISHRRSLTVGEICQTEGQASDYINVIAEGRVGTVVRIPNITYNSAEIVLDTLRPGELLGWSALIRGTPWSTLRVLEPTEIIQIEAQTLLDLCERYPHIGFIVMKNLSSLIASRLRRNRISTLNTIVAIKGGG